MPKAGLFHVNIRSCDPANLGSADADLIGMGDDGFGYVIKTVKRLLTCRPQNGFATDYLTAVVSWFPSIPYSTFEEKSQLLALDMTVPLKKMGR